MSLVRYTNKKTGVVTIYESTSHYDPVTKQSRPTRKYLGVLDPQTGDLIPSTGKPGRKKGYSPKAKPAAVKEGPDYKQLYEQLKKDYANKEAQVRELERKNKLLLGSLEHVKETVSKAIIVNIPAESK